MAQATSIEWTDATWNPVTGCSKVSPGCANCYAEAVTARYAGRPGWIGEHRLWTPANAAHNVRLHPDRLDQPLRWRKPRRVFVNSMSDLFHEDVPDGFIAWVFWQMSQCPQHTFQVLTKRSARMRDFMVRWADRLDRDENGEPEHRMALARGPKELRAKHNCGRALLMADMLEQWGEPPAGCAYPTYDWMDGPITWPDVPDMSDSSRAHSNMRLNGKPSPLRGRPSNNPNGRPPVVYASDLVERVRTAYEGGATQREVAEIVGIGVKVVQTIMVRHGIARRLAAKRDQRGAANTSWKGDDAGYQAMHVRVARERGAPQACARCGTTDPALTYDWANLTGDYADISDYERMCRSCHRRYDNARRRGEEVMNNARA